MSTDQRRRNTTTRVTEDNIESVREADESGEEA